MSEIKLYKDLAARYLKVASRANNGADEMMVRRVGYAVEVFGNRKLNSFSKKDVTLYKEDMLDRDLKNSTINSNMGYFLRVLRYGMEDLEIVPSVPKFRKLATTLGGRVLSDRELDLLLGELPPVLSEIAEFGVHTGLRGINIKRLRWSEVDNNEAGQTNLSIEAIAMKSGKALLIPLSDAAVKILHRRKEKQAANNEHEAEYVFTHAYTKRPYSLNSRLAGNAWRSAVKRAGIESCGFHDIRRTFATRHVEAGTPPQVIKALGAWATMDMVDHYTRLSTTSLRQYASNGAFIYDRDANSVVKFPSKHSSRQKSRTVLANSDKIALVSKS